jgi:hypothetical protein
MGPDCGLTPGQSGRLTVARKITLTLTKLQYYILIIPEQEKKMQVHQP